MNARTLVRTNGHPVPDLPPLPPVEAYLDDESVQLAASRSAPVTVSATKTPKALMFLPRVIGTTASPQISQAIQNLAAGVTVSFAQPNGGKSAFWVDAGLHVAARAPAFFGRKVRGGPVLYVAAEAPSSIELRARVAIREKFDGKRLPFYIVREMPRLGVDSADLEHLIAAADHVREQEGEPLVLAVFDTVAMMLAGGDENGEGMVCLAKCAREFHERTGAVVVLIHHPSKADPDSPRGHTSLPAAADAMVKIEVDTLTKVRTARVVKGRDFATGDEIHFALQVVTLPEVDQFGDQATTVIVRASDQEPSRKVTGIGKNQQTAMTALREWVRTHPVAPAISTDELTSMLRGCGVGDRRRRPEVIDALTRTGVLTHSVGGFTIEKGLL